MSASGPSGCAKALCGMILAPFLVTVVGGLAVEFLKPGEKNPGEFVNRLASSPAPTGVATKSNSDGEKNSSLSSWKSREWRQVDSGSGEYILVFRDNKMVRKEAQGDGLYRHQRIAGVYVQSNSSKPEFVGEPSNSDTLEKLEVSSASTDELIVTTRYYEGGQPSKYSSVKVNSYRPLDELIATCSRMAWGFLIAAVAVVVTSLAIAGMIAWNTTASGCQTCAVWCLVISGCVIALCLLIPSVQAFFDLYFYKSL
jgi:hypothetical protein